MSNSSNNWNDTNAKAEQRAQPQGGQGNVASSLLGLLGETSMTGSQRDVPEVNSTAKAIEEQVEAMKNASLNEVHRAILPSVTILTKQISSQLPGIALHVLVDGVALVFPVLFSNRSLTHSLEDIQIMNGQQSKTFSQPITPINYVSQDFQNNVKEHFKGYYASKGVRDVQLVNLRVIDLEQYSTEESLNRGIANILCSTILRTWEQGVGVMVARTAVQHGIKTLPKPYVKGGNAYGQNNCAVARVEPITGQLTRDGIPSSANLQVRLQTSNGNNNGYNAQLTSKELVTALATVTLNGQPLMSYVPPANQGNQGYAYGQNNNGRPFGYKPLVALVTYNYATAGEVVGDNSGLASYFLGLAALLASNNNYLFTEGLRGKSIGTRGSLVVTENIIKKVDNIPQFPRQKEAILTESKVHDIDYLNNWIKNNIMPTATFATDIAAFGTDSAINNFLLSLGGNTNKAVEATKVLVAILDSVTDGGFSAVLQENITNNSGWRVGHPVLHPSTIMLPFGTFEHEGKLYDLSEVDEIKVSGMFPNDQLSVDQWLTNVYGDNGNTPDKVRQFNIRTMLNSFFSNRVNLTGFGSRYYWDPAFNAALVRSLKNLGQLQATGTMGTFRNENQVFASGFQYMTQAAAGSAGGFTTPAGNVAGNATTHTFG